MSDQSDQQNVVEEAVIEPDNKMNDTGESKYENLDLSAGLISTLQLLDMVNAQLGNAGALVVNYYQIQKQQADMQMQQQGGYPQQQPQQAGGQSQQQPQYPPIVQDFASLANILTQIQYDLFDITVTLAQQQLPEQIDSRIDEKAIQWITDISTKISGQLPQHTDPVLPIGNQLATAFYITKTYCQQAASGLAALSENENVGVIGQGQSDYHGEYLNQLQSFLFAAFRWSNLILGERDWFWKPKSEMKDKPQSGGPAQPGGGQSGQQPQSQMNQQPMQQQPQPMQQAPMMGQPMMQQPPQMGQPMMSQPVVQQPPMGQPMQQQPMMNQPMMQQPPTNNMNQARGGMNGMQQPSAVSGK